MQPANPFEVFPGHQERTTSALSTSSPFGKAHWILPGILWFGWSSLYVFAVSGSLDSGNGKLGKVLLTPIYTLGGPMIGAWIRGSQQCCLDVSLWILAFVAPILLAAAILQFVWRPRHRGLRILRLTIWCLAWTLWFAGGLPSLAHALS